MNQTIDFFSDFKSWIHDLKHSKFPPDNIESDFVVSHEEFTLGYLVPFTHLDCIDRDKITLLSSWRNESRHFFLNNQEVNFHSTSNWIKNHVIQNELRELFWVVNSDWKYVGHIGVKFDQENAWIELDSILRGVGSSPGLMSFSMISLEKLISNNVHIGNLHLRVLSQNQRAIKFYEKLGYHIEKKMEFKAHSDEGFNSSEIYIMSKRCES
jgi:RimJ/RimL family protein N-acetyltransferase